MSRFGQVGRRPDHWATHHERARARAAERMAGQLDAAETAWLDEHLGECVDCAAVAAAYDADRLALRALREAQPEPPRDLWARTAAAIERESANRSPATGLARRGSRLPVGALSGAAVVVVVLGVSALSGVWAPLPHGTLKGPDEPSPPVAGQGAETAPSDATLRSAGPTPMVVGAGDVEWLGRDPSGGLAYNTAPIDEVCPAEVAAGCAALPESTSTERLSLSSTPRTIFGSPNRDQAVAIAADGVDGDQVVLVRLPEPDSTSGPQRTPAPTRTASSAPSATTAASDDPSATPTATASVAPGASTVPLPTPSITPEPTVAASLAIASDVEVVGESAAFSADGQWFAFTARPADGSSGPDVYVWKVGDAQARALTSDGVTYFASWDGGTVVASRPIETDPAADATAPETVQIDPSSGTELAAGDLWRPVVDPTRRRAIGWAGSITSSEDGTTWTPDTGRLELRSWSGRQGTGAAGEALDGTASPKASDFDIRWDETGEWVGIWVADPNDPVIGRLSLHRLDAETGELDQPEGAPAAVVAMPGFSIGDGRLAWATPPGQGGEGSTIRIVAWSMTSVGQAESVPGEDLIVIR